MRIVECSFIKHLLLVCQSITEKSPKIFQKLVKSLVVMFFVSVSQNWASSDASSYFILDLADYRAGKQHPDGFSC